MYIRIENINIKDITWKMYYLELDFNGNRKCDPEHLDFYSFSARTISIGAIVVSSQHKNIFLHLISPPKNLFGLENEHFVMTTLHWKRRIYSVV